MFVNSRKDNHFTYSYVKIYINLLLCIRLIEFIKTYTCVAVYMYLRLFWYSHVFLRNVFN